MTTQPLNFSFELVVLREMGIKKNVHELGAETRKNLRVFCTKWADVFGDLDRLKEKSFEQFIDEVLKDKSKSDIKNWYIHEIADRQQKLSVITSDSLFGGVDANPIVVQKLEQEIGRLYHHAEPYLGRHFHIF